MRMQRQSCRKTMQIQRRRPCHGNSKRRLPHLHIPLLTLRRCRMSTTSTNLLAIKLPFASREDIIPARRVQVTAKPLRIPTKSLWTQIMTEPIGPPDMLGVFMTIPIGRHDPDWYATLEGELPCVTLEVKGQCSLTEHLKFWSQHSHQRRLRRIHSPFIKHSVHPMQTNGQLRWTTRSIICVALMSSKRCHGRKLIISLHLNGFSVENSKMAYS